MMVLWNRLRAYLEGSFWFLPSLIVACSIWLALVLVQMDSDTYSGFNQSWPRFFGASPEGARGMLSTIAGSMMTVVGVTFSATLVTLALAASQYTSRILRNFIRDRVTQITLGSFAGVFAYCLIVLRTIEPGFVPSIAVSIGFALALAGISLLIFFIHHIATSIQAATVIGSVADETSAAIDRLFPEQLGQEGPQDETARVASAVSERLWHSVAGPRTGFLQDIDGETLLRLARERGTVVRMAVGIGDFVVKGSVLAWLSLEEPPDERTVARVQATYSFGRSRTLEQDPSFGIRQIVDVALRALSPGVNDTTTAVMCVDYLAAILSSAASRSLPSRLRYEGDELRVIAKGPTFPGLLGDAFDQIRQNGGGNLAILLALVNALQTIGTVANPGFERRRVLGEYLCFVAEVGERTLSGPHDVATFERRLSEVRNVV